MLRAEAAFAARVAEAEAAALSEVPVSNDAELRARAVAVQGRDSSHGWLCSRGHILARAILRDVVGTLCAAGLGRNLSVKLGLADTALAGG